MSHLMSRRILAIFANFCFARLIIFSPISHESSSAISTWSQCVLTTPFQIPNNPKPLRQKMCMPDINYKNTVFAAFSIHWIHSHTCAWDDVPSSPSIWTIEPFPTLMMSTLFFSNINFFSLLWSIMTSKILHSPTLSYYPIIFQVGAVISNMNPDFPYRFSESTILASMASPPAWTTTQELGHNALIPQFNKP